MFDTSKKNFFRGHRMSKSRNDFGLKKGGGINMVLGKICTERKCR
jgi:hypothetical protein